MYELDYEEDPGWMANFINWTTGLWTRWTAPDPEKIPFDANVLKSRLGRCLTRIKVLRHQQDAYVKQEEPKLLKLAKDESPAAEVKVAEHWDRQKLFAVFDLLEPHLLLLKDSVNLPTHDESPLASARAIIYAASEVPRLEELALIRQQLMQKYNPVIAIIKVDLLQPELVQLIQSHTTNVSVLQWLNEQAPNRCWAQKLEIHAEHRHPSSEVPSTTESQPSQDWSEGGLKTAEGTQETQLDAPDFSDDDNSGDEGGFHESALGRSNDSGPTDSPIPPLGAEEFPSIPNVALYPVLSLSDSLEAPSATSPPSAAQAK